MFSYFDFVDILFHRFRVFMLACVLIKLALGRSPGFLRGFKICCGIVVSHFQFCSASALSLFACAAHVQPVFSCACPHSQLYERVDRDGVFLFLRVDSSSLHASGCVPDLAVLDMLMFILRTHEAGMDSGVCFAFLCLLALLCCRVVFCSAYRRGVSFLFVFVLCLPSL